MIRRFLEFYPEIPESCYVDIAANVIGNVKFGENVSVWPCASVRGETEIRVGNYSNIQDSAIIHGDGDVIIGDYVSLGHGCIVHGATLGNNILVGMGAIVLDGAKIGDNCIIGAGALITGNKVFEEGSLIIGSPARAVRKLSQEEIDGIRETANWYLGVIKDYKSME